MCAVISACVCLDVGRSRVRRSVKRGTRTHIMFIAGCTRASYRSVTSYRAEIRRVHSVCSENPDSPRVFAPSQKLQATTKKNGETGADFAERRECALLGSPCAHLRVRAHDYIHTQQTHATCSHAVCARVAMMCIVTHACGSWFQNEHATAPWSWASYRASHHRVKLASYRGGERSELPRASHGSLLSEQQATVRFSSQSGETVRKRPDACCYVYIHVYMMYMYYVALYFY